MRVMLAEDHVLLREGMAHLLREEGHEILASVGDADSLLTAIKAASVAAASVAPASGALPAGLTDQPSAGTADQSTVGTADQSSLGTADQSFAGEADPLSTDPLASGLPDVVVVDVRMPPTHTDEGIQAALAIREQWPSIGVLVHSQYVEKAYATELIVSGQDGVGYLLKDRVMRVDEFLQALDRVGTGGVAFDPDMVRQLLARTTHTDPLSRLTPREHDVLEKMAEGQINAAIAEALFISQSAVEKHINSIFDKFNLNHVTGYSRRVLAILQYLGT